MSMCSFIFMDFISAVKLMKDTYKDIRRRPGPLEVVLCYDVEDDLILQKFGKREITSSLHVSDVMAADWELVEGQ